MNELLEAFGLNPGLYQIDRIGTGHIHETFRVKGPETWILQRINKSVFRHPDIIAKNWRLASDYLLKHYPDYVFLRPSLSKTGLEMVADKEEYPWRLFPYLSNTITIDSVSNTKEAYAAASAFGGLTRRLNSIDMSGFAETIPRFHDLALRYEQFSEACRVASPDRLRLSRDCVVACESFSFLVSEYTRLVQSGALQRRITHNDTKINNVLLDAVTREARCVIDLDTLMPGYFIYDFGDMVRTFVSPVDENERNVRLIVFREEIFEALQEGYLSEMGPVMSPEELKAIPFAGKMMTFIMALRFLADYLKGDKYYHIKYPEHNLVRATNQLKYLEILSERFLD